MNDVLATLMSRAESGDSPLIFEGQGPSFMLDSPKAVLRRASGGSKPRPKQAPKEVIAEYRLIRRTDPHVAEFVNTYVDYLVGSGFNISPANIPYTDVQQTPEEVAQFKALIENSNFEAHVLPEWVDVAITDGTGFLEIVVEDEVFKPRVLPTERMRIVTDDKGIITGYEMESVGGGDPIPFDLYDLAILRFHTYPGQHFGRSLIEPIKEHVEMLRDMEIDLARFIATKAYPPILWKCGTEERPWNTTQVQDFIDSLADIEPDSMIGVKHDVEHDIVGTTSTSSTAGALNLEPTFLHLLSRMHTGFGIPDFFHGGSDASRNEAIAVLPKFDRRVQRYRSLIRHVIRYQVFVSILGDPSPEDYTELPPDFQFGQHSSEEERLETNEAIQLFNMGMLTREAFAERVGIDVEQEMPDDSELVQIIALLQELSGRGDQIQNPNGGRPTSTGTGVDTPGQEVKTRQNPERPQTDESRPQRDISQE